jgi:hypothetical protein
LHNVHGNQNDVDHGTLLELSMTCHDVRNWCLPYLFQSLSVDFRVPRTFRPFAFAPQDGDAVVCQNVLDHFSRFGR